MVKSQDARKHRREGLTVVRGQAEDCMNFLNLSALSEVSSGPTVVEAAEANSWPQGHTGWVWISLISCLAHLRQTV